MYRTDRATLAAWREDPRRCVRELFGVVPDPWQDDVLAAEQDAANVAATLPPLREKVLTVASPPGMPATTTSPLSATGCWRTTTKSPS